MPALARSSIALPTFTLSALAMSALAGAIQLPKGPAKGFNLLLVGILLTLGQFKRLQQFLHLLER